MRFVHVGFAPDLVDYEEAWALQREVHGAVVAGEQPDTTLLLEHAAVYTAGKNTAPHERPWDGTPVIEVDRGGRITWHGPGQLVGYPIVRLAPPIDVVALLPGPTRTEGAMAMMAAMAAERGIGIEQMEQRFLQENRPSGLLGRFATPEEVAAMSVYVASPQASATTGAALRVDGGIVESIA